MQLLIFANFVCFRLSKIKDNSINKSIAESKTTIIESKLEAQV